MIYSNIKFIKKITFFFIIVFGTNFFFIQCENPPKTTECISDTSLKSMSQIICPANCAEDICRNDISIAGKTYMCVHYKAGTFYDQTYNTSQDTLQPYDGLIIEGEGTEQTILNYLPQEEHPSSLKNLIAAGGLALVNHSTHGSTPKLMIVRNLQIQGGYNGWIDFNLKIPSYDTHSAQLKWQKAIYGLGKNTDVYVRDVKVSGFYYGVTAEAGSLVSVVNSEINQSGDGGFFAYDAGHLCVLNSTSRGAASAAYGLGFGFVAESLHYTKPASDPTGLAQCRGSSNEDNWSDPDFILCVINASLRLSSQEKSKMFITHSISYDNLMGGFLANMGAEMHINESVTYNQYSQDAISREPFLDYGPQKPNIYVPGQFSAGDGFVSRLGSFMYANNTHSFNNLTGYNAYWDGEISANNSMAWNNAYYGYHSVLHSTIYANSSSTFGDSQTYGYAVELNNSVLLMNKSDSYVQGQPYHGTLTYCEFFQQPCLKLLQKTPEKFEIITNW